MKALFELPISENETAKQLPDKCIQALDAWVESINDKKEE